MPQLSRLQTYSLSIALLLTSGCAHTKPLGQTLVALGALAVGANLLDAAGVFGSKCSNTTTPQGEPVQSCSGDSLAPQPLNILGIAFGAGLIGGGIALWTTDSQSTPTQPTIPNIVRSTATPVQSLEY